MTDMTTRTQAGPLVGSLSPDGQVAIFLGVPYAAPPIGPLRWQAPQPVTPWTTPRRADAFGPKCPQISFPASAIASTNNDTGVPLDTSEDCLYLNVWAPRDARDAPVLLWVHGGGNRVGSSATIRARGESLARKGIIVVTFNYRINALGFLAHPELSAEAGGASGNYALMDTLAVLRWVADNIAAFGGDPARVTLAGYSMAASQVTALMANANAAGLFAQVICQSPMGCFAPFPPLADAEAAGAALAEGVGASDLAALRAVPADALVTQPGLGPVIDGRIISKPIKDAFDQGRVPPKPILLGYTADEGTPFPADPTLTGFRQKIADSYGPQADRVLALYPAETDAEALHAGHLLMRDVAIGTTTRHIASRLVDANAPVFAYSFNRPPPFRPGTEFQELGAAERYGAYHGSDTAYWFDNLGLLGCVIADEDAKLADMMSRYWVNFVQTGDPNGDGLPPWPAFTTANDPVLLLDTTVRSAPWPNAEAIDVLGSQ